MNKPRTTITTIIADDHPIYINGLRNLLEQDDNIEVIGEAANGNTLINMALSLQPDVVITDIKMPGTDGIEAVRTLIRFQARSKCILISGFDSNSLVTEALDAGAHGFLLKNANRDAIITAVKNVHNNLPFYCPTTTTRLLRQLSLSEKWQVPPSEAYPFFDETDKKIIRMLCREYSNNQIAETLFLSTRTVEGRRARIMEKMNTKTPQGIVLYAIRYGIFFLDSL
jgi:DNA-binding NarL/FixJ family response regulator